MEKAIKKMETIIIKLLCIIILLNWVERLNKKDSFMQIIALINQKGGAGKTACAINIGAGLNTLNKLVLLIDLDPQAHF